MAKSKTEVAAVPGEETKALAAIPADLVQHAGQGTQNLGKEDARPPRLMICQSGSPQRKPDDPKEIEGLRELDLFNDLTGEIYGRGPLRFVVVLCLGARHIEFNPMEDGGGVKDYDVKPGDPRTQFTTDQASGERVKPVATKFYDYVVWLPDYSDVVALSMKSTQLKVAMRLNGLLMSALKIPGAGVVPNPPSWARTFELGTAMEKDAQYSWGNFTLKSVGITEEETRSICAGLAQQWSQKNIIIERDQEEAENSGM